MDWAARPAICRARNGGNWMRQRRFPRASSVGGGGNGAAVVVAIVGLFGVRPDVKSCAVGGRTATAARLDLVLHPWIVAVRFDRFWIVQWIQIDIATSNEIVIQGRLPESGRIER